jgi:signal transduction histidine kinase/CheY-like chemotaxis protein
MNAESIYIGAFGGALACLFVLTAVLARIQRDYRMATVLVPIAGFACFFLADRVALSKLIGFSETKTWMATSVAPLLMGLIAISYLIAQSTNMKDAAPNIFKLLMSGTSVFLIALIGFIAPIVAQKYAPQGVDLAIEGLLVPLCFTLVAAIACISWLTALSLTPVLHGEWRLATVGGIVLTDAFLIAYSLVLYQVLPFNTALSNELRLTVIGALGCLVLAASRRAQFDNLQKNHWDKITRSGKNEAWNRQASQAAIGQAHLMNVLKREKELEAELRKREAEQMQALKAAKEAADEMARSKANFLAFMSHEIRTPLNGIMGMVRLLMGTDVSEQQRDYIQTLNYSGDALLTLVNDTLDISKIEAGQLVLESIDFDLQRLISSIIMLMSARASEKNLLIRSDIAQDVPKFISGDPTRLRQIMLNLINNAIKFTEEGGITVKVRVLPGAREGTTRLRMDIQDTGPGISEEGQARLFKEYSQVDTSTTRLYGGTGLGLSICKQLVQAMDGQIGVDSQVGRGSSFWFIVDFKNTAAGNLGEMQGKTPGAPVLSAMVIEDNEIHQKVIGGYLRLDGHKTTLVGSAEEALDKIAAEDFDVLLMDVNLPGIDGNEATRRIRKLANPIKNSVPIIAITGNTSPMDIDECRQAGMNDFVGKPVDPEALRATVFATHKLWLEQRHQTETTHLPKHETDHVLTVLIVDDNDINQRVIGGFLGAMGHKFSSATSGEKAVQMVQTGDFDLVLMDVTLPGIDGLEASRRIRALANMRASSVPIAAITGNTSAADRQACLDAGMNDFLGKPIDPDGLEAVIARINKAPVEDLADYLPKEAAEDDMLDEAVLARLVKAFNVTALSGLLGDMIAETKPILSKMDAAVAEEDLKALKGEAHTLKGMAITLGVIAVGELAADIETSIQRGVGIGTLGDMVAKLGHVFEQSVEAIDHWRERNARLMT